MSSPLPNRSNDVGAGGRRPSAERGRPIQAPWSPLEATLEVMDDRWKTR
mgnify:CR=1 FL=1